MAWVIASTGEDYTGEVHYLGGNTYSGATRTPASRRLIEVPDAPKKAEPLSQPKPKAPRKKAEPKPKGATAWD